MKQIKARNNFALIKRDETPEETGGLLLPTEGKEKPQRGLVLSVGSSVEDKQLLEDVGEHALFHQGCGFTIEYEGEEYLVIKGEEIIGVV